MIRTSLAALALLIAGQAAAMDCTTGSFEGVGYSACTVTAADDVRLYLDGPEGVLGGFGALRSHVQAQGLTLAFAMNAGMYHRDASPVGLYVQDGVPRHPVVTAAGPGNFGMLPNGVFCIGGQTPFAVIESRAYAANPPACRHATQSGPMLVIGGELHPRFLVDSTSLHIRNGVGVSADGQRAVFVISDDKVTFHRFARLIRDGLGYDQALYLDGSVSRLYAPSLGRDDFGWPIGPMVAVVGKE